jgi:tetratricopeptide (TPR) repeat protein
VLSLLLFGGCSTKKNTFTRRVYHNLTCHYNIYWNGNESLKKGEKELKKSVVDDYSQVLRVYNYGTVSEAQRINSMMDRTLQKGSIGVQRHSMRFDKKEQVRWVDDSYLMMGKAHFLKQDYISARRTFDYVAAEYNYNDIVYTAGLWLAKTNIQLEQYQRAEAQLLSIQAKMRDNVMPREIRRDFNFVMADYYIASKQYNKAIPYLKDAILFARNRQMKTRAMFILGQIYFQEGDLTRSLEQFNKVAKRNPSYEMQFEARINLARAYNSENSDSRQIIKVLQKMLKDQKNADFKDKIYFALADVALKDKDENLSIEYLKKSVASSTTNKIQRASSSLQLAGILFDRKEYLDSQAYYDTAVSSLDTKYPGYDSIFNRSTILSDLVQNLVLVETNDSLLRIARMDSVSRNKLIDKLISNYIEEELKKKQEEMEEDRMTLLSPTTNTQTTSSIGQSGEWYFYNPNTLSHGYSEFMRKWGRRNLEDNWNISDKSSISLSIDGESGGALTDTQEIDSTMLNITPRDRKYYLVNLPLTLDEQQVADVEILEALNNIGYIYMERLEDNPRSIDAYLDLNKRYPLNKYELQSWYALYKLYGRQQQITESDHYKSLILTKYPDSDYARVILDPEYFVKISQQKSESMAFYERTYEAYKNNQFYRVKMNVDRARSLYEADTALMPRFEFLRAVAIGKLETIDSMAYSLATLVEKYPKSAISAHALNILKDVNTEYELNIELPKLPSDTMPPPKESIYKHNPNELYNIIVICNSKKVKVDPLRIRISDFNQRNYQTLSLTLRSLMLDSNNDFILITSFKNLKEAKTYYEFLVQSDYVFGGMNKNDYQLYPISETNYPVFFQQKNLDEYKEFWEANNP